jgi:hypothetical protein
MNPTVKGEVMYLQDRNSRQGIQSTCTYRTEIVNRAFFATGGPSFVCVPPSIARLTHIGTLLRFTVPCSTQQTLAKKEKKRYKYNGSFFMFFCLKEMVAIMDKALKTPDTK